MHPTYRDPSDHHFATHSLTSAALHNPGRHSEGISRPYVHLAPTMSRSYEFNDYGMADRWMVETNRHTPPFAVQHSSFNHNHNLHRLSSPPSPAFPSPPYRSSYFDTRDTVPFLHKSTSPPRVHPPPVPPNQSDLRSTVCWGDLEPWMDEQYAKQVCGLMGWEPVHVKVPTPASDGVNGQQSNNLGYCFLTFPSAAQADAVIRQVNKEGNTVATIMPNSSKPFVLNWASSFSNAPSTESAFPSTASQQQYPREYSIFVGDLAPETSNSDLVAVFRNPVLGLRNDREPKFIRPFLSCKSAKIMLDPATGVSRGYGFVRFTDEADQQRALVEMHGLYCLSRPSELYYTIHLLPDTNINTVRISPATAKHRQPPSIAGFDVSQLQLPIHASVGEQEQPITVAIPLPSSAQAKNASVPVAVAPPNTPPASTGTSFTLSTSGSGSSISGSNSMPSLSSGSGSSTSGTLNSEDLLNLPNDVLAEIAQRYANDLAQPPKTAAAPIQSITAPLAQNEAGKDANLAQPKYLISEESWKHHAQARAILGNLIGPNGEQLTSTDPYNTTVFVGGLSPMISEDTLRTFFAPFGDIHYVKVPVGKHCGFVQFVKKTDAERAIEKMQGFPIGGSRIRLSWGRSQYKAAQAAAQAAQAAALQAQFQQARVPPPVSTLTPEQAVLLLQKCGLLDAATISGAHQDLNIANMLKVAAPPSSSVSAEKSKVSQAMKEDRIAYDAFSAPFSSDKVTGASILESRHARAHTLTSFSPFSPNPNLYRADSVQRQPASLLHSELLPHPSKSTAPGFGGPALSSHESIPSGQNSSTISPISTRPSTAFPPRYLAYHENAASPFQINRAPGRSEGPISRPTSSTQPSRPEQESDMLQDLNGTLASLDLDQAWKGHLDGTSTPEGITLQLRTSSTLSHSLSTP